MFLMSLWRNITRRQRIEADLDDEMRGVYEMLVEEKRKAGAPYAAARRAAAIELGGLEQVKEHVRDARVGAFVESVLRDIGLAFRILRRSPGFTLMAVATLALGIGANAAIFSVIDGVLLEPLPYPHADRIVGIWEKSPSGRANAMSTLNYVDYATQSTVFDRIAATSVCCGNVTLSGRGMVPEALPALSVSADYFDVFEATAALGRTFASGEDQPGRDHVAVISHKLWSSLFGSDSTLVGRQIRLNDEPYTVIGVMPANGPFDRSLTSIWLPLSLADKMTRNVHYLQSLSGGALARLKPGITIERARAEMSGIAARLSTDYPSSNKGWGVLVEPYASIVVGTDLRQSLYLLGAAVGMVLLIGCANLANLMLARGLAREREVAVRLALGAGRGRLIQQFLIESVLLSLAGGVIGIGVGYLTTAAIEGALRALPLNIASLPNLLPAEATIALNLRALAFTLTLSLVCGVGFGLAPAIDAIRTARGDDGVAQRAGATVARGHVRARLIVIQVAIAFVLLASAGLLIRSLFKMRQADTGVDTTHVIAAWLPFDEHRFATEAQLHAFTQQIITRLDALPGVRDAAFTESVPFQGAPYGVFFQIAGRSLVDRALRPVSNLKVVTPSYFHALGLQLRRGRLLTEVDRAGAPRVAVINDTMARMYFAREEPLSQHLLMEQRPLHGITQLPPVPWEIVGVIADERLMPFDDKREQPAIYVSDDQFPSFSARELVMRTSVDPAVMADTLRRTVVLIDKDQAVMDIKTLEQVKSESMMSDKLRLLLLGLFAVIALLLSAIGIYGVIAHSVVQRTREIGIRTALGASKANVIGLIVGSGMALTAVGLLLGCVAALGATRLLSAFLFGVTSSDSITLVATAVIFAMVAAIACYIPARNATQIDPLMAIRYE